MLRKQKFSRNCFLQLPLWLKPLVVLKLFKMSDGFQFDQDLFYLNPRLDLLGISGFCMCAQSTGIR
jgi:hypothetical protein